MILSGPHADSELLGRFRAEAEAVAQLQHPNIVQIYDIGEENGLPYFSLEFVDGQTLDEFRDGQPINERKAAELLESISRAMHFAHDAGIVHRDLKPANVLLTKDGEPKVTDFGLVKRIEGPAPSWERRTTWLRNRPQVRQISGAEQTCGLWEQCSTHCSRAVRRLWGPIPWIL